MKVQRQAAFTSDSITGIRLAGKLGRTAAKCGNCSARRRELRAGVPLWDRDGYNSDPSVVAAVMTQAKGRIRLMATMKPIGDREESDERVARVRPSAAA